MFKGVNVASRVAMFESLKTWRIIPSILFIGRLYLSAFSFLGMIFGEGRDQRFSFFTRCIKSSKVSSGLKSWRTI